MFSRSTATKIKAVCLVLLLAGSEAARIATIHKIESAAQAAADELGNSDVRANEPTPESAAEAEKAFKEANQKCNWQWSGLKCSGEECKYRPLPLDVSYSQGCRMSDDFMLNNTAEFYPMQTGVLLAKSRKFAKDCTSVGFFNLRAAVRCKRRMTHVMRAMTFTSKAEVLNKTTGLPKEQIENAQTSMKESFEVLAGALGEDGNSVLELIEKTKKSAAIRQDYKGTMKKTTKVLWDLLMGDDDAKKGARKMMDEMVEADPNTAWNLPQTDGPGADEGVNELDNMTQSLEKLNPSEDEAASFLEKMPSLLQEMQTSNDTNSAETHAVKFIAIIKLMMFIVLAILFACLVNITGASGLAVTLAGGAVEVAGAAAYATGHLALGAGKLALAGAGLAAQGIGHLAMGVASMAGTLTVVDVAFGMFLAAIAGIAYHEGHDYDSVPHDHDWDDSLIQKKQQEKALASKDFALAEQLQEEIKASRNDP